MVGARISLGLSAGGVRGSVRCFGELSVRLTPELSVGAANGSVGRLFFPVSRTVGVLFFGFICRAAAAARAPFEGDAILPTE